MEIFTTDITDKPDLNDLDKKNVKSAQLLKDEILQSIYDSNETISKMEGN